MCSSDLSRSRRLLLRLTGADRLAPALKAVGRGLLSILMLHRFTQPEVGVFGTDPATLRDQLAYLRRHRYRLLSLTDMVSLLEGRDGRWTTPAVAFTVDDGYAGFASVAAPMFAEFDCPVTLFVTTGFLDGRLWLWWDRAGYVFTHASRSSVVVRLGSEDRAYGWSTPDELARVRDDVIQPSGDSHTNALPVARVARG